MGELMFLISAKAWLILFSLKDLHLLKNIDYLVHKLPLISDRSFITRHKYCRYTLNYRHMVR